MGHHSGGERVKGKEVSDLPFSAASTLRLLFNDEAIHNVGPREEPVSEVGLVESRREIEFGQVLEQRRKHTHETY